MSPASLLVSFAFLSLAVAGLDRGSSSRAETPASMRALARSYYAWRDSSYPVASSDQGLHTWDDRITDYGAAAITARRAHVRALLAQVRAIRTDTWNRDDRIDWLLFRAQLEGVDFFARVLHPEESDPQLYVNECSNAVFSLLKKDYAGHRVRALAATARLERLAGMLARARTTLDRPVRLYARLAADAARGGDDLYNTSLMTLADSLSDVERARLIRAKNRVLVALHEFADWLHGLEFQPDMPDWAPMGVANYNFMLRNVLLLPFTAEQVESLGTSQLARYRGLEAALEDTSLASPNPARAAHIPKGQAEFLAAYQSREKEMMDFIARKRVVTIPPYIGPFIIRQLPEAFKPTSPGGFMNPPGQYDRDPSGFYFIPTYDPKSANFYIRAAIEDPRPLLGHEGIPGHFLQLSIANHIPDEIRRQQNDGSAYSAGPFVEGWALYTEEMLLREGLYPENSASHGQVLRLSRYRAARVGVDVNLQTGRWTFEQAVKYFMTAGGLDREAAEGEAAGAASGPSQKIWYTTGKWQITHLLDRYRTQQGAAFRLGAFHDKLLSYGSLPVSVIQWLMLDDPTAVNDLMR